MPILSNSRHERFAQELAIGLSATEAYERAGYKPNDGNASTLKGNQRISDRVSELKVHASQEIEVTLQWLIRVTEEARQLAMKNGQAGQAVAAIREMGVLSGHRVDRAENVNFTYDVSADPEPSLEAWEAAVTSH